jgi:hypothetical protein
VKLEGRLCIGAEDVALGYPCIDRSKVCEFSVDFYDEVVIRYIGVKDKEVVQRK